MTKKFTFALAALLALTLSACNNTVKQELGVGRKSQDEFTVVKRAPLSLPPDYTLRPPGTPPVAGTVEPVPTQTAKEAVLGKSDKEAKPGAGDEKFLDKLGAAAADTGIRNQIDEDNGYISLNSRTVADRLIHWDDAPSSEDIPASVVDAGKEAARIKENQAAGKPINDGTVPVIEKKKSTIGKIF